MSRSTKILTVFVFLLSLIPLLWFPGKTILLGYDNVYPLSPLPFLYDRMHSWSWIIGFGSDQSAIQGSLIIHIIDVLPQFLGFSHQASQKIVFSLWFFLLLASPFILATRLEHYGFVRSPFVRYFFPILYAVNFYTLQAWWIAERTKFSLMVATPLILAVILPLLQRRSLRTAILCGLLCALILSVFNGGGWAGFSLYGGLVAILFSFILFTTVQALMTREYKTILSIVLFFLVFGFFYLLLNAYTILPFLAVTLSEYDALISRSGGITSLVGWTRYLSENTSFINLMRLQAMPDWYNTAFHPYSSSYLRNPFLIGASFLFSIGLFAPFFFKRQITNGILVYFLLVLIVSLFLSAGSHKPFGSLFEFLMRNVPGFLVFRSAIFKFGYAFWLAAGFFISLTLSEITVRLSQRLTIIKGSVQVRQVGFVSLFISIIVLYHYPFLTGNFFQINKQPVMSRVSLPPYVASFAAWWKENGKDERILLLPRLSSNWYFELYTWSYLSLNPILANFGSKGIVENTVLLSPSEKSHLDALYQAIREGDDERMRLLSSMLGIQYLLLRKDFFHDYPGIETDNPFDLKKQLVSPLLEKEATFGEWDVYRFRESHQLFTTQTTAIASDNPADIHYELLDQRSLQIPISADSDTFTLSHTILTPECLSCQAERESTAVQFPEPRILMDSSLYQFVELRKRLLGRKPVTFDDRVFYLIGETLLLAGQMKELIEKDRGEYYINIAREKYITTLTSLTNMISSMVASSNNSYSTAIIIQDYLREEDEFLNDLVLKTNRKDQRINLELILSAIGTLDRRAREVLSPEQFNRIKAYTVSVQSEGLYTVLIEKESLGRIADKSTITLRHVGGDTHVKQVDTSMLSFEDIAFSRGDHELYLHLPPQQDLLTAFTNQEHAKRKCLVSSIDGFKRDNVYNLSFTVKNNFDPQFMFFVDEGEAYAPKLLDYFPVSGEREKNRRYVLSTATLPLKETATTVRIGFCAPSLTEEKFRQNILNLSVVELTAPRLSLIQTYKTTDAASPNIQVEKQNQLTYKIRVTGSTSPFYLSFLTRYSPSWVSDLGTHTQGNDFNNVWYIDKKGDYTVRISYVLQKHFVNGLFLSVIALVVVFSVFIIINKSKSK